MSTSSDSPGGSQWQRRIDQLAGRVEEMEARLGQIREELRAVRGAVQSPAAAPAPTVSPAPSIPQVAYSSATAAAAKVPNVAVAQPVKPLSAAGAGASSAATSTVDTGSAGMGNLEAWIGGAWLSWLAAVCAIFAGGWFFKYAAEQGWISPWLRVCSGWVACAVLLAVGEVASRRRMEWFAAGVTGAGLGLGYLAGYGASPLLYDLIRLPAAYGVLSVVTVLGLVQAVRLKQQPTAVLALLGGFLTLVLLKSPNPTAAGLLGYLFILNLGALGAGQLRRWPALRLEAWIGTALLVAMWLGMTHAPGEELAVSLTMVSLLFALFQVDIFMWRLRAPLEASSTSSVLATLNCTGLVLAIAQVVQAGEQEQAAGIALYAVAVFQAAMGWLLWRLSGQEQNRRVAISFFSQAALAAAVALPMVFDRSVIAVGWAGEALLLAWLVKYVRSVLLRLKVVLLLGAAVFYILAFYHEPFMVEGQVATRCWLAGLVLVAGSGAAWLSARWYGRSGWTLDRWVAEASALAGMVAGAIALATWFAAEPVLRDYIWSMAGVAVCVGLLSYRASAVRLPGLMAAWLVVAGFLTLLLAVTFGVSPPPSQTASILSVTYTFIFPLGGLLAILGYWNGWLLCNMASVRETGPILGQQLGGAATAGLLLVFHTQLGDDSRGYAVMAAGLAALLLGIAGRIWRGAAYEGWAAAAWFIAAVYWLVYATLMERFSQSGVIPPSWTEAVPFGNAIFLAAVLVLAVLWPVLRSLRGSALVGSSERALLVSLAAGLAGYMVVQALSLEVDRWFLEYGAGRFNDPAHAERVALSVLWALLALTYIAVGLVASVRGLRLFGLVLFAITAGKVLLVDMAQVQLIYRVLSTLGLSLLSLGGSYAYQRGRRRSGSRMVG